MAREQLAEIIFKENFSGFVFAGEKRELLVALCQKVCLALL
jgi:hypothetical protein